MMMLIGFVLAAGCSGESVPTGESSSAVQASTTSESTTTDVTIPPTTVTTAPPAPVAATTPEGQAVPAVVLDTAEQIYRAAQAQDIGALGALAATPDFTYSFGDPPGDPVTFWSADPTGTSGEMVRVLEQSVATDGTEWWWPAEWLTDETYFGFRIGIGNDGTWRYSVEGE